MSSKITTNQQRTQKGGRQGREGQGRLGQRHTGTRKGNKNWSGSWSE